MPGSLTPTVTLPRSDVLAGLRTVGWWGMLLLILSEATLFGALISTYFFLRANSPTWPAGGIDRPECCRRHQHGDSPLRRLAHADVGAQYPPR